MIVGLPERAREILSKFMWGSHFLHLNRELFEAYAVCTDGPSVVAAQARLLASWELEKQAPLRTMPPDSEDEEGEEGEESEEGKDGEEDQVALPADPRRRGAHNDFVRVEKGQSATTGASS